MQREVFGGRFVDAQFLCSIEEKRSGVPVINASVAVETERPAVVVGAGIRSPIGIVINFQFIERDDAAWFVAVRDLKYGTHADLRDIRRRARSRPDCQGRWRLTGRGMLQEV